MKKILPHPIFFVAVAFCFAVGRGGVVLYTLAALLLHESGHYFAARRRGFALQKITLTPFGATMALTDGLPEQDELFVAAAGPVVNLLACPLVVTLWWVFPALYPLTRPLVYANFLLALYNVLPVYPFDGGRILLALVRDQKRAYAAEKILAYGLSALLSALGVLSLLYGYGVTLLLAGVTLFFCTVFPSKNAKYDLIVRQMLPSPRGPLSRCDLYCDGKTPLFRLLRHIRKKRVLYVVHVSLSSAYDPFSDEKSPARPTDGAGRKTVILCGEQLNALFWKDRRLRLEQLLS